jgi:hypothetical protein
MPVGRSSTFEMIRGIHLSIEEAQRNENQFGPAFVAASHLI